jgi:hypothetical protein
MAMNGINYNNLLGSGLFTNNGLTEEIKNKGNVNSSDKKAAGKDTSKNTSVNKDTFEYSGTTREVKAGYERPKSVISKREPKYKPLDSDGIQEGIKLSDAAKNLLNELREKYGVILELLNAYEPAYNEFKSLLLEAQNDSERGNVFCRDDYANKYLSRLKAMDYYKKYYKQSWSIRYLDDLITSAVEKLNNHRSGVTADFGDLFLVKKGV